MILLVAVAMLAAQDLGFEPLYRESLARREASLGPSHPKTAESARDLGLYLARGGAADRAREPLERALAFFANSGGVRMQEQAEILEALGRWDEAAELRAKTGDWAGVLRAAQHLNAEAETSWYRRMIAAKLPAPSRATALHNLASSIEESEPAMAERHYREALALRQKSLGANNPELAATRLNLAGLLLRTDRAAAAVPLARAALAVFAEVFGEANDRVASAASTLAGARAVLGGLAEAEQLYRRALRVRESALGKEHPRVADDCENLADLLEQTHRAAEVSTLRERAQRIRAVAR